MVFHTHKNTLTETQRVTNLLPIMRQKDKNETAIKNSVIILYKSLIHNMKKIDLNAIQKGNKKENTLFTRVSNSKKKQVEAVASELGINTSQFVRASIDNFLIQLS